jgi:hypothetical protein
MQNLGVTRRVVAAAVAACSAVLLAGCAPGPSAAPRASTPAAILAVWQRFATCARAHGAPTLPDPALAADGTVSFPGFNPTPAVQAAVRRACGSILNALPPNPSAAGRSPADLAALLRFAQCMRTHGLPDWPDPKQDGTFPASALPAQKTPAVLSAMAACDHLNPDPSGHVYGS